VPAELVRIAAPATAATLARNDSEGRSAGGKT
jgi:hypothetical protein